MLTLTIHPPILNKLNFYLYILIEPTKRFKMILLLFKYFKDKWYYADLKLCSALYRLELYSGKFLLYTGTNRLQKGTIRVLVLSSWFRNNCFIPEKIFRRSGQLQSGTTAQGLLMPIRIPQIVKLFKIYYTNNFGFLPS